MDAPWATALLLNPFTGCLLRSSGSKPNWADGLLGNHIGPMDLWALPSSPLQVQGNGSPQNKRGRSPEPWTDCLFSPPSLPLKPHGNPKKPLRQAFVSTDSKVSSPAKMVRPAPTGVVSASALPITLSRKWRSRQREDHAFSYMRDLVSVLHAVAPRVLEDPRLLNRCLLLDGVPPSVSPSDLVRSILGVQIGVLVRDIQTGFRVGLIVFFDVRDRASVTVQAPREGLYAACTPANRHGDEVSRSYILDGVADEFARRSIASLFRSLLPPQYVLADEDRDFHLRTVLIGASRDLISDGAQGLCDLAWKVLFARGFVVAAVVHSDRQAGVLVYDDTECTELVARREPQLMYKMGLQLFDSSLFPSLAVADPADRDASLLRRLLPQCVTCDEESYRRRVLLFTGLELDSHKLDAADFAHFLHSEADLIHAVEAVIIHRMEGLVVVVLGSSEDALSLLRTPMETWLRFFGQKPGCASVFGFAGAGPHCDSVSSDVPSQEPSAMMGGTNWTSTEVFRSVKGWIEDKMRQLNDDDIIGFVDCLIRRCALTDPDSVMRSDFAERALLLSGVAQGIISDSDLQVRHFLGFGVLDASAVEKESRMALAMVVFRCWHAAARLLREPQDTWAHLGFQECTPVPDAEHAGGIAKEVVNQVLMEEVVDHVLR